MEIAIDEARLSGKIAEAAICYTGDILDDSRAKYSVKYYQELAKALENSGAHIIAIKDMAGLLKPEATYRLISELKAITNLPIHLHTHDTSGNGILVYTKAIAAGVDIIDTALGSMSGLTSQPSANSLYYATKDSNREIRANIENLEQLSYYWEDVRKYYNDFESGMNSPHSEVYVHEMPGGQYSNLQQQAKAVGLGDRWVEVKNMYSRVNLMFGDIIKVTPSSKVVGDMALFMVQNELDETSVLTRGKNIDFPDSVIEFFQGYLGQPYGGFPKELQSVILKDREAITVRHGELLNSVDFNELKVKLKKQFNRDLSNKELLAYILYPKVFEEYIATNNLFGDVSVIDTPTFFNGLKIGEEIDVEIEKGKTLIVKLVSISKPQHDGTRIMAFDLNGQSREIAILDSSAEVEKSIHAKMEINNSNHIGATMPGSVLKILVSKGDRVKRGDNLIVTEAMKMETTIKSSNDGFIKDIYVSEGEQIITNDLLIELE